ncbi:IS630 family transposase [Desulforhopalus singaporensis]|uniref:Transposase n=1 Tax=Desulforhopalus singaporensis TaxID=91360 RepID=A0A1H0USS4_9BACT|nr:IS630 family transposase [Desulforhopalus singaporensis]SDP68948.1 Transposase [Desulforhopalus singaporensis]
MKKQDARKLSQEIQQYNRDQAIRLFKAGRKRKDIAKIIGVSYSAVCKWISIWEAGGRKAIVLKKRGRSSESQRLLTAAQEKALKKLLVDKNPKQLKLPFALWNRKAIQSAVYQIWRVKIALRTIGDYMKRWGLTPQKQIKRAYERSPKAIQKWLDETYPEIKARAAIENGEIYWGDETGARNDCNHSQPSAPKGKTPIVEINPKRFSINMISATNNQGLVRFMMNNTTKNARVLLRFMKRLIKDSGRKVFLVLDILPVHHAKLVRKWLKRHENQIEVFYLPSYSPELNPDEHLNYNLKTG